MMNRRAKELLKSLNVDIDPNTVIEDLSISEKQIVEIAKAISKKAKILVMDEPTAALSEDDTQALFKIIGTLKDSGVSIIYISHRLKEIFEITDRVTVLRDGKKVKTIFTSNTDSNELVALMVGRDIKEMYPKRSPHRRDGHGSQKPKAEGIKDVSFELKRGEILGNLRPAWFRKDFTCKTLFGANPIKAEPLP
jgi:ribose transport system ATP-binding protein